MAWRVRKSPESIDPRDWHWSKYGWGYGAVAPYNWRLFAIADPPHVRLAAGLVAYPGYPNPWNQTPEVREWGWSKFILGQLYESYLLRIETPSDPIGLPGGATVRIRLDTTGTPAFHWSGERLLTAPYPIQPFTITMASASGSSITPFLNDEVTIFPVKWDTPLTPMID